MTSFTPDATSAASGKAKKGNIADGDPPGSPGSPGAVGDESDINVSRPYNQRIDLLIDDLNGGDNGIDVTGKLSLSIYCFYAWYFTLIFMVL